MRKISLALCLTACVLSISACGKDGVVKDLSEYTYENIDVSSIVAQADEALANEKYDEASDLYLNAIEQNMKNMDARKGLIKCLIKQENYSLAYSNLETLVSLNPADVEVYQFYIELAKATDGNTQYTTRIRELADQYAMPELLDLLPATPQFSYEAGEYDEQITVKVTCDEPGAEIYYSIYRTTNSGSGKNVTEFPMTHEPTTLTVWCLVDGVPSAENTAEFICNYPDSVVTFSDSIFENAVRNSLDKPEGEITDSELEKISHLYYYDGTNSMSWDEREKITDITLDDAVKLPNLGYISVYNLEATVDVSALKNCLTLYQFSSSDAIFTNLDDFMDIPSLKYLTVNESALSDISALSQMDNLYSIDIHDNPLNQNDLEVLRDNNKITNVTLSTYQVDDYSLFKSMENLYAVYFYNLEHVDYSQLVTLNNITQLGLNVDYDNRYINDWDDNPAETITDLSFLKQMPQLTYLDVEGVSDTSQLEYIKTLENLENLYLYNCKFEDESVLEKLQEEMPKCNIRY